MTWLKIGEEFADECAGLSDAAFRAHVEGLVWAMRRETGGRLAIKDLRRCLELDPAEYDAAIGELVTAGFWKGNGDGYVILHQMWCQPEPEIIAARRDLARARQRKQRMRRAGLPDEAA